MIIPFPLDLANYRPEVDELVHFWTGRGSYGYAVVREIKQGRYHLDPHATAVKGSDYRPIREPVPHYYWPPRDRGVTLEQLTQPPQIWFRND